MSTDFIKLVPKTIESLVSGWAEIGAKNHIVEKKNFGFLVFFFEKSVSQAINARNNPAKITNIVRLFKKDGRTKGVGLNPKKMF